jgi:hypothetical protein
MRRHVLSFTVWSFIAIHLCLSAKAQMGPMNSTGMFLMDNSSGTALNPKAWEMPMVARNRAGWNGMFMASAFLADIQQSGPRGGDKLFSPNWFMASASHRAGHKASFDVVIMLSLEPATVTDRRYPLLFQTGETAFGHALTDAQHPHNFVMSAGVHYARDIGAGLTLQLYAAPVGDPALGPVAYPHRASAMEIPQATLSHHLQDSTHISDDTVTAGIASRLFRIEASGFHGAEPGENRWTIQQGAIDSWSGRLWWTPSKRWVAQVSGGRIHHPEALEAGDQVRLTASAAYERNGWSSTLIWGRTHNTESRANRNGWLAETLIPAGARNRISGRMELVDKDELFDDTTALAGRSFRIFSATAGYTREIAELGAVRIGIGANVSLSAIPDELKPSYGDHPKGATLFLRFRLEQ